MRAFIIARACTPDLDDWAGTATTGKLKVLLEAFVFKSSPDHGRPDRSRALKILVVILIASLAGKLCVRFLEMKRTPYWQSGYSLYYQIAQNLIQHDTYGRGDLTKPGARLLAGRVPAYPFFIATICRVTNNSSVVFVICEGLLSTLAVALVFCITSTIGLAGNCPAVSWLVRILFLCVLHDTQLQENCLLNNIVARHGLLASHRTR